MRRYPGAANVTVAEFVHLPVGAARVKIFEAGWLGFR
jgi:hypothetical protein